MYSKDISDLEIIGYLDNIYYQKGASFTYEYTHDYDVNQSDVHKTSHELKLAYIELNPTISYKATDKLSLNFKF